MVRHYQRPSVADAEDDNYTPKYIKGNSPPTVAVASKTPTLIEEEFFVESRDRLRTFKQEMVRKQQAYFDAFCNGFEALQQGIHNLWSTRQNLNRGAEYEQTMLQPLVDFVTSLADRIRGDLNQIDGQINTTLRIHETRLPSLSSRAEIQKMEQETRRTVEAMWCNATTSNAQSIIQLLQAAYIPLYIFFRGIKLPREFLEEWRAADQHLGQTLGLNNDFLKLMEIEQAQLLETQAAFDSVHQMV